MANSDRVAIVGMGGIFPRSGDVSAFWSLIESGTDASTLAPAGRWFVPPEHVVDGQLASADHVPHAYGCYLPPFTPNVAGLALASWPIDELDPVFHVALHIGNTAWQSAQTATVNRARCGVIFGNIALPTEKTNAITREAFGSYFGLPSEPPPNRMNLHAAGLPAALLARGLGFGLGGFTLDAACASSLYAIKLACDELLAGRADAMIAGGLSRPDCQYTQMGFSQLNALAQSGCCAPFDVKADGLVVGEGGCAFVLKRLRDAVAQGDRIFGVIAGIGLSNDVDGNLLLPASEGQLRAMRSAYLQANWKPSDVQLIECHATGTPTGDAVEFASLRTLWEGEPGRAVIGCVKSSVGHLLTGAGAAGLAKVLLAIQHRTLPPTANFEQPSSKLAYADGPFRVLQEAETWSSASPRRAAVSAFGFGGINAHLLVEEYLTPPATVALPIDHKSSPIAIVGVASRTGSPLAELELPLTKFRIPPKELQETLPQQTLMLHVATQALDDVQSKAGDPLSTGVFIGMTLDPNTSNFHLRWATGELDAARKDRVHPPLNANRTMGALASIAASRIARFLGAGGPSFSLSDEEAGGLRALSLAASALNHGEIDQALVGAVDFVSDERWGGSTDGAAALVLKRLADATRDGDRIYATFNEVPSFTTQPRPRGQGAAGDLVAAVQACQALFAETTTIHQQPAFWLHDAVNGRRKATVESTNVAGYGLRVELAEGPPRRAALVEQPPLPSALFLLSANSVNELQAALTALRSLAGSTVHARAQAWWTTSAKQPRGRLGLAIVADSLAEWDDRLTQAEQHLRTKPEHAHAEGFFYNPQPLRGSLAFVYPGSGNHFPDMGRELGRAFPRVLHRQMLENDRLASQYHAHEVWGVESLDTLTPRDLIFAQVSLGTLISDLLALFGVKPNAAIGYSLGESASMYGTRAWRDRDEMFRRMSVSSLFTTDLSGPCHAARQQWKINASVPIDWLTGVVSASAEAIRAAITPTMRAYLLIINTANDCVIGGQRDDVLALAAKLGTPLFEVRGVTTAHCEVAEPVRGPYRELHHLPTTPPEGVRFYSGVTGRAYDLNADSAADAITAAVLHTIDFPKTIQNAYADGVRLFVEIGPGHSCTRMIGTILEGQPHMVRSACVARQEPVANFLKLLGQLHTEGIAVNLELLYNATNEGEPARGPSLRVPVGYHPQPMLPTAPAPVPTMAPVTPPIYVPVSPATAMADAMTASVQAHDAYLRFSTATHAALAQVLALQTNLLQQGATLQPVATMTMPVPVAPPTDVPRALNFEQCNEFAVGKIGNVLGPLFAAIDAHPTRVRLPEGPLQLVDRITLIEGEPKSLSHGRVLTEHDVHAQRWYLDAGRIPTCVAVEAGQADLFLSGFLGIDFVTQGLACYRLLDATVTFHRPLPAIGDTIKYDIHIDSFFRQGDTYLFRFHFESTVNGEPLLSMREGCAGFFSAEELAGGKGIVHTAFDLKPIAGQVPAGWQPYEPLSEESLSEAQVDALRTGDLVAAFGRPFERAKVTNPLKLPGGMLKLVHRIERIVPKGGRYGLGQIRGEADIHPDDWFLTCHFVDDQVMPGTLMYECCMHTLRVLLMRMGFVGEEGEYVCEPLPGITSRLKCRGQVIASTKKVTYEVSLKEIGFEPNAYILCDALMYADGKPIVEITNMSLRMTGLTRERLDAIWSDRSKPLFDYDDILAFAIGKPSEAFGDRYRIFDSERVIARLPGPPYQFLDRITSIKKCEQWKHAAGGEIVAEYDVPPNEWYFAGNRCNKMPFSVLLEIALQPCGWLAAYLGSALTSNIDLSFRNLGGSATQFAEVHPDAGTLTTKVKITKVSSSGGMIIQNYDYDVRCQGEPVYIGNTYFGFFSKDALANQVGLKDAKLMEMSPTELFGWKGPIPKESPFPDDMLRMVDTIQWHTATGGPKGLGTVSGRAKVNPEAWFFKAHFHQDPVWPGSLGLESFIQLLKLYAYRRWGKPANGYQAVALQRPHQWVYRGQILPTDDEVTVQAYITLVDDTQRLVQANGLLSVDGRMIYQMTDFAITG